MQAVILAAGRGARMGALTDEIPKSLLEVADKSLLEWKLAALPEKINEVILIVGYFGSKIQEKFNGEYAGKKILYVEQDTLDGTAGALWRAKDLLHDQFLVCNGDDIYAPEDIEKMTHQKHWAVLGLREDGGGKFGVMKVDAHGKVTAIVESTRLGPGGGYVSTGLFTLDPVVFECTLTPKALGSNEYGLPQSILASGKDLHLVEGTWWYPLNDLEDLKKAQQMLAK